MFRPRHFITVVAVCMMAAGCTSRDDGRVNMEILLSTVWCGERFTPDIQQNTVPERDAESVLFLYIFGEDGILSVFAAEGEGTASEPVEQLRYIYTPKAAEMVIDSYGTFTVREISVERLWLEGVTGSLDLRFHADTDAVPERERAAGLPHNGQKR